jgi:hypothetical protein
MTAAIVVPTKQRSTTSLTTTTTNMTLLLISTAEEMNPNHRNAMEDVHTPQTWGASSPPLRVIYWKLS